MGITFDSTEQTFVFDFEHDGTDDIVTLTGNGYQVEAFGKCFYYGYEFSEQVDGSVRYNLVVMPESSSKVNQYMLRYIYRFAQPMLRKMELVKALPASISFDMDGYEQFATEQGLSPCNVITESHHRLIFKNFCF